MQFLNSISLRIDAINRNIGKALSWATLLLVTVTFVDVVMRYF